MPRAWAPLLQPGAALPLEALGPSAELLRERGLITLSEESDEALVDELRRNFLLADERLPRFLSEESSGPAPDEKGAALRASEFLASLPLDAHNVLLAHPFLGTYQCLSSRLWSLFSPLLQRALTPAEWAACWKGTLSARAANRFLTLLRRAGLVVDSATHERERILRANPPPSSGDANAHALTPAEHSWHSLSPVVDVDTMVNAGCNPGGSAEGF